MVERLGAVWLPQHRDAGARGLAGELAVPDELRGESALERRTRMLDVLSEDERGDRLQGAVRRNRHLRGQRVRSGLDVRGKLLVRERALPHAHFVVVRARVAVACVLRAAEEESRIDKGRQRPAAVHLPVLAFDLAGLRVAAHRAHRRGAVPVVHERHGDVARRPDRVRTQHLESGTLRSATAHLDAVRAGLRGFAPRHREVVLVVRAVVEDTRPEMDGPKRRPHLDRDVGAVRRKDVPSKVEMSRFVRTAGQNECRRGKVRLADALRLHARHGILHVPREAPPVRQRVRRHHLSRCKRTRAKGCRRKRNTSYRLLHLYFSSFANTTLDGRGHSTTHRAWNAIPASGPPAESRGAIREAPPCDRSCRGCSA